ncbi:MAG: hypothetical protein KVP17_000349 [Porospora cf. gigantea B]|uniref:uncharacterized protein n=1 Tax=Porospora cf. gigantea B TaxID=2853592 RepID=UPI0035719F6D|nr:MAG: hypothetical protein KVP17_000349 [Porospora cf. gigantea B]
MAASDAASSMSEFDQLLESHTPEPTPRVSSQEWARVTEYEWLEHERPLIVQDSETAQTIVPRDAPWSVYLWTITRHMYSRKPCNKVIATQGRITLWEALEEFDIVNDFLFLIKVAISVHRGQASWKTGLIALVCLTNIYVLSVILYSTRQFIIYHRIGAESRWLFRPFVALRQVRLAGETDPTALFMFERLLWTYQLIMRVFEDIPQAIVSALFLATYGRDFYTSFNIAFSLMMSVLSSYRMGIYYPMKNTLALLLSKEPPIHSPALNEASTTTRKFPYVLCLAGSMWTVTFAVCLLLCPERHTILFFSLAVGVTGAIIVVITSAVYALHLERQYRHTAEVEVV